MRSLDKSLQQWGKGSQNRSSGSEGGGTAGDSLANLKNKLEVANQPGEGDGKRLENGNEKSPKKRAGKRGEEKEQLPDALATEPDSSASTKDTSSSKAPTPGKQVTLSETAPATPEETEALRTADEFFSHIENGIGDGKSFRDSVLAAIQKQGWEKVLPVKEGTSQEKSTHTTSFSNSPIIPAEVRPVLEEVLRHTPPPTYSAPEYTKAPPASAKNKIRHEENLSKEDREALARMRRYAGTSMSRQFKNIPTDRKSEEDMAALSRMRQYAENSLQELRETSEKEFLQKTKPKKKRLNADTIERKRAANDYFAEEADKGVHPLEQKIPGEKKTKSPPLQNKNAQPKQPVATMGHMEAPKKATPASAAEVAPHKRSVAEKNTARKAPAQENGKDSPEASPQNANQPVDTYLEKKQELKSAIDSFTNREQKLTRRLNKLTDAAKEDDSLTQEYRAELAKFRRAQRAYFEYKRDHITNAGMWNAFRKKDTSGKKGEGKDLQTLYEQASQNLQTKVWDLTKERIDAMSGQEWERLQSVQGLGMDMNSFKRMYTKRKLEQAIGLVANHTIVREAGILEQQVITESFANRKQGIAEKAIRGFGGWYKRLPTPAKYAISMGIGGVLMASGVGVGGAALGVGALATRKALGFAGGAAGAGIGKWVGNIAGRLYGKNKVESATQSLKKESSVRHSLKSTASKKDIMALLNSKETIERNENRIKAGFTVGGAIVGGGSAAIWGPELLGDAYDKVAGAIPESSSEAGAAGVTGAENTPSYEPTSVTVGEGKGAVSMFSDLKEELAKQYPDPDTAPEVVKRILTTDASQLAQEHGFWDTGADGPGRNGLESALIEKGATLEVTDRGELIFTQGGDRGEPFLLERDKGMVPSPAIERDFAGEFTDGNKSLEPVAKPEAPTSTAPTETTPVDTAEKTATAAPSNTPEGTSATAQEAADKAKMQAWLASYAAPDGIPQTLEYGASQSAEVARDYAQYIAENQQNPETFAALAKGVEHLEIDPSIKEGLVADTSHKPHLYLLEKGEYAVFSNPDATLSPADTYQMELAAAAEAAKETGQAVHVPYEGGREYARVLPNGEVHTYGGLWGSPPGWMSPDKAVLEVPMDGETFAKPIAPTAESATTQTTEAVVKPEAPVETPKAPASVEAPAETVKSAPVESAAKPQTPQSTTPVEQAPVSIQEKLASIKPTGADGLEAKVPGTELRDGVPMFKSSEWTKMQYWSDDKNLYVVGEATSKDPGFAMQKADLDARSQVLKITGQNVNLSGSTPVDYFTDPKTGKTFSLIQVPKAGVR